MTDASPLPGSAQLRQAGEAFVLHTHPYKETSLLVDLFTRCSGRVTVVARAARRPRSVMRGTLMSFQPLLMNWSGKGEVKTLYKAEWQGGVGLLRGEALLCGFYLNELLIRLLAREDPHEVLFDQYSGALRKLSGGDASAPILRQFEKTLLKELGYALVLEREVMTGAEIDPLQLYTYDPEKGPLPADPDERSNAFSGRTLLGLAHDKLDDPKTLNEARTLMRRLISHRLESRQLNSRKIYKELLEL